MVCKKSLYCLKNGPCATYQIRKQIWEDNIRFRESLRNINQSDHYWSFQVTNNDFSDLDEPSFYKKKNKACWKVKNCYDCASVTHELSTEPSDTCKTCTCSKGKGSSNKYPMTNNICLQENTQETKAILVRPKKIQTYPVLQGSSHQRLNSCNNLSRLSKNVSECHRYRNSLSSAQLLPSTKVKFSSQSTLLQPKRNVDIKKFPSTEVISKEACYPSMMLQSSTNSKVGVKANHVLNNGKQEKSKLARNVAPLSKLKNDILRNKDVKLPPWLSGTPISRTTRKMLSKDKQIPFATFGCNNANDLVGSKRTHNVFASTTEIFPNALSAKHQREEMIAKSLKTEKCFRNSLLQDNMSKKLINHSSLWATESINDKDKSCKKDNSLLQKKQKKINS